VIDVEQRALRSLEEHRRVGADGAVHHEADVFGEREESRREPPEQLEHRLDVDLRVGAAAGQASPRVFGALLHDLAQPLGMTQVEHAHAAPRDLVFVRRPDAAPGRADRLARRARAVHLLVIRQDEMRPLAHVESPLDVDSGLHEAVDLVEQRVGIEHDAVADRAAHAGMQDAARNLMEDKGPVAEVHRVAGVCAALVADHPVGPLGQHVHELALPFVSPLRPDDDDDA